MAKKQTQKKIIVVLGMHRGGTSVLTHSLKILGVDLGDNLISAAEDNPKGFWEDKDCVRINEEILKSLGTTYSSLGLLPTDFERLQFDAKYKSLKIEAVDLIRNKFVNSDLFGFKDPRTARLLPFWKSVFMDVGCEVNYLIVFRNPLSVASSLLKRDGWPTEKCCFLWLEHNVASILEAGFNNSVLVEYDMFLESPKKQLKRLSKLLKLKMPKSNSAKLKEFLNDFLDVSLRHTKFQAIDLENNPEVPNDVAQVFKLMQHLVEKPSDIDNILIRNVIESMNSRLHDAPILKCLQHLQTNSVDLYDAITERDAQINQLVERLSQHRLNITSLELVLSRIANSKIWRCFSPNSDQVSLVHLQNETSKLMMILLVLTSPVRAILFLLRKLKRGLMDPKSLSVAQRFYRVGRRLCNYFSIKDSVQNLKALNAMASLRNEVDVSASTRSTRFDAQANWPVITISIVTYNNGQWLDDFLNSLLIQNYPLNKIRLVFIDNSSTDDTPILLVNSKKQHGERFTDFQVFNNQNDGFGAGHDVAIRQASTQFVLVSNIDIKFLEDSIPNVVQSAQNDLRSASWELRQMPYEHPKFVDPVSLCVNWSSHACVLISKEKYIDVGGYEKRIFMYGEDVELSYRFRQCGYQLKYVPSAVVIHNTYSEPGEIKTLQFSGSVLSNYFIRLRYGRLKDIVGGQLMLCALFLKGAGFKGSRKLLLRLVPAIVLNTVPFLMSRKQSGAQFPIRGFDYELTRHGSFYESKPLTQILEGRDPPLITVITRTVDKRQNMLRQCLMSVINQTYPNIEHLVVEDGGNAASPLVEKIAEENKSGYRLRHIACAKKGRSHAGNNGLKLATGKYVLFLDDDDLLFPDHLEILLSAIMDHKSEVAYSLAWNVATEYVDMSKANYKEISHKTADLFHQPFNRSVLQLHNYLPIQSVLFKKQLFDSYGGFDEDLSQLEDWVLWKKYAQRGEFVFVPKTTSLYRTPANVKELLSRNQLLHDAYDTAQQRYKSSDLHELITSNTQFHSQEEVLKV